MKGTYKSAKNKIDANYNTLPLIDAYRKNLEHINKLSDVNAISYEEYLDLKVYNIMEDYNKDGRGKR